MGALWSLVLEGKVTSFLYYRFPWTILGICLSFWSELKNFDKNFGVGLPDYCRRHFDKRTLAQSPPGKAPETLESQKWIEFFVLDTFCWKFGNLSHVALCWTSLNWTLCDGRIVLDNGWRLQCVGKYSKDVFFWTRVCFLLECWERLHTLGKLRIACFLLD